MTLSLQSIQKTYASGFHALKNINLGGCHLDFNLNPKGFPGIASKRRVIDLSGYSEKLELRGNCP